MIALSLVELPLVMPRPKYGAGTLRPLRLKNTSSRVGLVRIGLDVETMPDSGMMRRAKPSSVGSGSAAGTLKSIRAQPTKPSGRTMRYPGGEHAVAAIE